MNKKVDGGMGRWLAGWLAGGVVGVWGWREGQDVGGWREAGEVGEYRWL